MRYFEAGSRVHPSKKLKLKFIAALLVACILFQELGLAMPQNPPKPGEVSVKELSQNPTLLEIPSHLGRIEELRLAKRPDAPLVIHIQDPHANVLGQQNLAGLLEHMARTYQLKTILVEGAEGDVTLTQVRRSAPTKELSRAAKSLLMEAQISGEEYLNLTSDLELEIVGVENLALYAEGLKVYAKLAAYREDALRGLQEIRSALRTLKAATYPPRLIHYETLEKSEQLKFLFSLAIEDDRQALAEYPQLSLVGKLIEQQQAQPEIEQDLKQIDWAAALAEQESLEHEIYQSLLGQIKGAQGQDAIALRAVDRYIGLLEAAYRIQMSTKEYREFEVAESKHGMGALLAFLNRLLAQNGYIENLINENRIIDAGKADLKRFYQIVDARDLEFIKHLESSAQSSRVVAMVTGGYHARHLRDLFIERDFSFAVITPQVSRETNWAKYESALLEPLKTHESAFKDTDHRSVITVPQVQTARALAAVYRDAGEKLATLTNAGARPEINRWIGAHEAQWASALREGARLADEGLGPNQVELDYAQKLGPVIKIAWNQLPQETRDIFLKYGAVNDIADIVSPDNANAWLIFMHGLPVAKEIIDSEETLIEVTRNFHDITKAKSIYIWAVFQYGFPAIRHLITSVDTLKLIGRDLLDISKAAGSYTFTLFKNDIPFAVESKLIASRESLLEVSRDFMDIVERRGSRDMESLISDTFRPVTNDFAEEQFKEWWPALVEIVKSDYDVAMKFFRSRFFNNREFQEFVVGRDQRDQWKAVVMIVVKCRVYESKDVLHCLRIINNYNSSVTRKSLEQGKDSGIVPQTETSYVEYLLSLAGEPEIRRRSLFAMGAFFDARPLTQDTATALISAVHQIQTNPGFEGKREEVLVKFLEGLTETKDSQLEETGSGANRVENSLNSLSAYSSVAGARLAESRPDPRQVESDYKQKLESLTKIEWNDLPQETKDILLEYGVTEELVQISLAAEKIAGTLFQSALPAVKKLFTDEEFKIYWPDIVQMSLASNMNAWQLMYSLSAVKNLFTPEELKAYWPDLVQISLAASVYAYNLFASGLPKVKKLFTPEEFKAYWPDLVQMSLAAKGNASALFRYGLPTVKALFTEQEFKTYWPDLVQFALAANVNAGTLFSYGFYRLKPLITDRESLKAIGGNLIQMSLAAKDNADHLFQNGLAALKESLGDQAFQSNWPGIVAVVTIFKLHESDKILDALKTAWQPYHSPQAIQAFKDAQSDNLIVNDQTNFIDYVLSLLPNQTQKTSALKALLNYSQAKQGQITPAEIREFCSAIKVIQTDDRFVGVREEMLVSFLEGLTETKDSQLEETGSGANRVENSLNSLSAYSSVAGARLAESKPDPRQVEIDYARKLKPLTGVEWNYLPGETKTILVEYGTEDLAKLSLPAGPLARGFFMSGLPAAKALFTDEEFKKYWPDLVQMALSAKKKAQELFQFALPIVKNLFTPEEFKLYWPDIVQIALAAKDNADSLFKYGLPNVKSLITDRESLKAVGDDLVQMSLAAKDNAGLLFYLALPAVKVLITDRDSLKAIGDDLVQIALADKENFGLLFKYAFPTVKALITNRDSLKAIGDDLVQMSLAAKRNARALFQDALPKVKASLGDQAFQSNWKRIVEIITISKIFDEDNILVLLSYGSVAALQAFKDAQSDNLIVNDQTNFIDYVLSLLPNQTQKTKALKAILNYSKAKQGQITPAEIREFCSAIKVIQTDDRFEGKREEMLVSFLEGLTETKDSQSDETDSGEDSVENLLNSLSAYSSDAGARLAEVNPDPKQVEDDYVEKIKPLTEITWKGLPSGTRSILLKYGVTDEIVNMALASGKDRGRARHLFKYGLPNMKKLFSKSEFESAWPDIVRMAMILGGSSYSVFQDAFPKVRKIFTRKEFIEYWPILIEIAISLEDGGLFIFNDFLPAVKHLVFSKESLKDVWSILVAIRGSVKPPAVNYLFMGLASVSHLINSEDDLIDIGQDLVDIASAAGENAKLVFEYGLPSVGHLIRSRGDLKTIGRDLVDIANASEVNAEPLFQYTLPAFKEIIRCRDDLNTVAYSLRDINNLSKGNTGPIFQYSFPAVQDLIHSIDDLKAIVRDFVDIVKVSGNRNLSRFFAVELPAIKASLGAQAFKERWTGIVSIITVTRDYSSYEILRHLEAGWNLYLSPKVQTAFTQAKENGLVPQDQDDPVYCVLSLLPDKQDQRKALTSLLEYAQAKKEISQDDAGALISAIHQIQTNPGFEGKREEVLVRFLERLTEAEDSKSEETDSGEGRTNSLSSYTGSAGARLAESPRAVNDIFAVLKKAAGQFGVVLTDDDILLSSCGIPSAIAKTFPSKDDGELLKLVTKNNYRDPRFAAYLFFVIRKQTGELTRGLLYGQFMKILSGDAPSDTYGETVEPFLEMIRNGEESRSRLNPDEINAVIDLSIRLNRRMVEVMSAGAGAGVITFRELVRFNIDFSRFYLTQKGFSSVLEQFMITAHNIYGRALTDNASKEKFIEILVELLYDDQFRGLFAKALRDSPALRSADIRTRIRQIMAYADYENIATNSGSENVPLKSTVRALVRRAEQVSRPLLLLTEPDNALVVEDVLEELDEHEGRTVRISASAFSRRRELFGMYMPNRDEQTQEPMEWRPGVLEIMILRALANPKKPHRIIIDNVEALPSSVRVLLNPVLWERSVEIPDRGQKLDVPPNLHFILTMDQNSQIQDDSFMNRPLVQVVSTSTDETLQKSLAGYLQVKAGVSAKVENVLWSWYSKLKALQPNDDPALSISDLVHIARRVAGRARDGQIDETVVLRAEAYHYLYLRYKNAKDRLLLESVIPAPEVKVSLSAHEGRLYFGGVGIDAAEDFARFLKANPELDIAQAVFRHYKFVLTDTELRVMAQLARDYKYGFGIAQIEGFSGEGKTEISRVFSRMIGLEIREKSINGDTDLKDLRGQIRLSENGRYRFDEAAYLEHIERGGQAFILNEINTNQESGLYYWFYPEAARRGVKYLPEFSPAGLGEEGIRSVTIGRNNLWLYTVNPEGYSARRSMPRRLAALVPRYTMTTDVEDYPQISQRLFDDRPNLENYSAYAEPLAALHVAFLQAKYHKNLFVSPQDVTRREMIRAVQLFAKGLESGLKPDQAFSRAVELVYVWMWKSVDDKSKAAGLASQVLAGQKAVQYAPHSDSTAHLKAALDSGRPTLVFTGATGSPAEIKSTIRDLYPQAILREVPVSYFHGRRQFIKGFIPSEKHETAPFKSGFGVLVQEIRRAQASPDQMHIVILQNYLRLNPESAPLLNEFLQTGKLDLGEEGVLTLPNNLRFVAIASSGEPTLLSPAEIDRFIAVNLSEHMDRAWLDRYLSDKTKGLSTAAKKRVIQVVNEIFDAYAKQAGEFIYDHNRLSKEDLDVFFKELGAAPTTQTINHVAFYSLAVGLADAGGFKLSCAPKPMTDPASHVGFRKDAATGKIMFFADGFEVETRHKTTPSESYLAPTENFVRQLASMTLAWKHRRTLLIEGYPGGGKTVSFGEFARRVGVPSYEQLMYGDIDLGSFLGRLSRVGKRFTLTAQTDTDGRFTLDFLKCYTEGGLFLLDEGAMGVNSQEVIAYLQAVSQMSELDLGTFHPGYAGQVIRRHEDFRIGITQNPSLSTKGREVVPYETDTHAQKIWADHRISAEDALKVMDYVLRNVKSDFCLAIKRIAATLHAEFLRSHPNQKELSPRQLVMVSEGIRRAIQSGSDLEGIERQAFAAVMTSYLMNLEPAQFDEAWQKVGKIWGANAPKLLEWWKSDVDIVRKNQSIDVGGIELAKATIKGNVDAGDVEFDESVSSRNQAVRAMAFALSLGLPVALLEVDGSDCYDLVKQFARQTDRQVHTLWSHPQMARMHLVSSVLTKFEKELSRMGVAREDLSGEFTLALGFVLRHFMTESAYRARSKKAHPEILLFFHRMDSIPERQRVMLNILLSQILTDRRLAVQDENGKTVQYVLPEWVNFVVSSPVKHGYSSAFINRFVPIQVRPFEILSEIKLLVSERYPLLDDNEITWIAKLAHDVAEYDRSGRFAIGYGFTIRDVFKMARLIQLEKQRDFKPLHPNPLYYVIKAATLVYGQALEPSDRAKFDNEIIKQSLIDQTVFEGKASPAQIEVLVEEMLSPILEQLAVIETEDRRVEIALERLNLPGGVTLANGISLERSAEDPERIIIRTPAMSESLKQSALRQGLRVSDGVWMRLTDTAIELELKLIKRIGQVELARDSFNLNAALPPGEVPTDVYMNYTADHVRMMAGLLRSFQNVDDYSGRRHRPRVVMINGETGTAKTTGLRNLSRVWGVPMYTLNAYEDLKVSDVTVGLRVKEGRFELGIKELLARLGKIRLEGETQWRRIELPGKTASSRSLVLWDEANASPDLLYALAPVFRGEKRFKVDYAGERFEVELDSELMLALTFNPSERYSGREGFAKDLVAHADKIWPPNPLSYEDAEIRQILYEYHRRGIDKTRKNLEKSASPASAPAVATTETPGQYVETEPAVEIVWDVDESDKPLHRESIEDLLKRLQDTEAYENEKRDKDGKEPSRPDDSSLPQEIEKIIFDIKYDAGEIRAKSLAFDAAMPDSALYFSREILAPFLQWLANEGDDASLYQVVKEAAQKLSPELEKHLDELIFFYNQPSRYESQLRGRMFGIRRFLVEKGVYIFIRLVVTADDQPYVLIYPEKINRSVVLSDEDLKKIGIGDQGYSILRPRANIVTSELYQPGNKRGYFEGELAVVFEGTTLAHRPEAVSDEEALDWVAYHELGHVVDQERARKGSYLVPQNIELNSMLFPAIFSPKAREYVAFELVKFLEQRKDPKCVYAQAAKGILNGYWIKLQEDNGRKVDDEELISDAFESDRIQAFAQALQALSVEELQSMGSVLYQWRSKYLHTAKKGVYFGKTQISGDGSSIEEMLQGVDNPADVEQTFEETNKGVEIKAPKSKRQGSKFIRDGNAGKKPGGDKKGGSGKGEAGKGQGGSGESTPDTTTAMESDVQALEATSPALLAKFLELYAGSPKVAHHYAEEGDEPDMLKIIEWDPEAFKITKTVQGLASVSIGVTIDISGSTAGGLHEQFLTMLKLYTSLFYHAAVKNKGVEFSVGAYGDDFYPNLNFKDCRQKSKVENGLAAIRARGTNEGSNFQAAIEKNIEKYSKESTKTQKMEIVMTDGKVDCSPELLEKAHKMGLDIVIVGINTPDVYQFTKSVNLSGKVDASQMMDLLIRLSILKAKKGMLPEEGLEEALGYTQKSATGARLAKGSWISKIKRFIQRIWAEIEITPRSSRIEEDYHQKLYGLTSRISWYDLPKATKDILQKYGVTKDLVDMARALGIKADLLFMGVFPAVKDLIVDEASLKLICQDLIDIANASGKNAWNVYKALPDLRSCFTSDKFKTYWPDLVDIAKASDGHDLHAFRFVKDLITDKTSLKLISQHFVDIRKTVGKENAAILFGWTFPVVKDLITDKTSLKLITQDLINMDNILGGYAYHLFRNALPPIKKSLGDQAFQSNWLGIVAVVTIFKLHESDKILDALKTAWQPYHSPQAIQAFKDAQSDNLIVNDQTNFIDYVLSLLPNQTQKTKALKALLNYSQAKQGQITPAEIKEFCSAIKVIQTDDRFVGVREEMLVSFLEGLTETKDSQLEETGSGANRVENSLNSLSAYSSVAGARLAESKPDPKQVELDYSTKLQREIRHLKHLSWPHLSVEAREILLEYGITEDIIQIARLSDMGAHGLFQYALPVIKNLFTREEFKTYWPDLIRIAHFSGWKAVYILGSAFPIVKNLIADRDSLRRIGQDLIDMAIALDSSVPGLFNLSLPSVRRSLGDEEFQSNWPNIAAVITALKLQESGKILDVLEALQPYRSREVVQAFKNAQLNGLIPNSGTSFTHYVVSLCSDQHHKTQSLKALLKYAQAKKGQITQNDIGALISAIRQIQTNPGFEGKREEVLVKFLEGLTETESSQTEETGSGENRIENSLNSLSAYSNTEGARLTEAQPDPKQVELDYAQKLEPLTHTDWTKLPPGTRNILLRYGVTDELIEIASVSGYKADHFFSRSLPKVQKLFTKEEFRVYWPDLVGIALASSKNDDPVFEHGLSATKHLIHSREDLRVVAEDLAEIAKTSKGLTGGLFGDTLPAVKNLIHSRDDLKMICRDLIRIGDVANGSAEFLFTHGFPTVKELIRSNDDLKEIGLYLVEIGNASGANAYYLFYEGLPAVREFINSKEDVQVIGRDLAGVVNILGESTGPFFAYHWPQIKPLAHSMSELRVILQEVSQATGPLGDRAEDVFRMGLSNGSHLIKSQSDLKTVLQALIEIAHQSTSRKNSELVLNKGLLVVKDIIWSIDDLRVIGQGLVRMTEALGKDAPSLFVLGTQFSHSLDDLKSYMGNELFRDSWPQIVAVITTFKLHKSHDILEALKTSWEPYHSPEALQAFENAQSNELIPDKHTNFIDYILSLLPDQHQKAQALTTLLKYSEAKQGNITQDDMGALISAIHHIQTNPGFEGKREEVLVKFLEGLTETKDNKSDEAGGGASSVENSLNSLSAYSSVAGARLTESKPDPRQVEIDYTLKLEPLTRIKWGNLPLETEDILLEFGVTEDIIEIAHSSRQFAGLAFRDGLPTVKKLFTSEEFKSYWPSLVEIARLSGENASDVFQYGLPATKDLIRSREDLAKIGQDLTKIARLSGENANHVFKYGFTFAKDLIRSREDLIKNGQDLAKIARLWDWDADKLFLHILPAVKKSLGDQAFQSNWKRIVTIIAFSKHHSSDGILLTLTYHSPQAFQAFQQARSDGLISADQTNFEDYILSLLPDQHQKTQALKALLNYAQAKQGKITQDDMGALISAIHQIQTNPGFEGKREEVLVKFLKGLTETKYSQSDEAGSGANSVENSLNSLSAYSSVAGARFAKSSPDPKQVEDDYNQKLEPLVGVGWYYLPIETKEILLQYGVSDDLIQMSLAAKKNAWDLFRYALPTLKKIFTPKEFKAYWPDLVRMSVAAKENAVQLLRDGIPATKPLFTPKEFKTNWPDLVQISLAAKENAGDLFKYSLPNAKQLFTKEFKTNWPDLVKMCIAAQEEAASLFGGTLNAMDDYYFMRQGSPRFKEQWSGIFVAVTQLKAYDANEIIPILDDLNTARGCYLSQSAQKAFSNAKENGLVPQDQENLLSHVLSLAASPLDKRKALQALSNFAKAKGKITQDDMGALISAIHHIQTNPGFEGKREEVLVRFLEGLTETKGSQSEEAGRGEDRVESSLNSLSAYSSVTGARLAQEWVASQLELNELSDHPESLETLAEIAVGLRGDLSDSKFLEIKAKDDLEFGRNALIRIAVDPANPKQFIVTFLDRADSSVIGSLVLSSQILSSAAERLRARREESAQAIEDKLSKLRDPDTALAAHVENKRIAQLAAKLYRSFSQNIASSMPGAGDSLGQPLVLDVVTERPLSDAEIQLYQSHEISIRKILGERFSLRFLIFDSATETLSGYGPSLEAKDLNQVLKKQTRFILASPTEALIRHAASLEAGFASAPQAQTGHVLPVVGIAVLSAMIAGSETPSAEETQLWKNLRELGASDLSDAVSGITLRSGLRRANPGLGVETYRSKLAFRALAKLSFEKFLEYTRLAIKSAGSSA